MLLKNYSNKIIKFSYLPIGNKKLLQRELKPKEQLLLMDTNTLIIKGRY